MTQILPFYQFGTGKHGDPSGASGVINTYASCTGVAGNTEVTTGLSVSVGDIVLLHQSQHLTDAGKWEVVYVASTGVGKFYSCINLTNSYSTGAQAVLVSQYTGGTLSGNVSCDAWNGTVGGIVALMSNGGLDVSGVISANGGDGTAYVSSGTRSGGGTGGGFRGGNAANPLDSDTTANQGEGTLSAGTTSTNANGNGGGGATTLPDNRGGGGAGGGNGTAGTAGGNTGGTAGGIAGTADLTTMVFGGGGGGGCKRYSYTVSGGGAGGGIVLVIAKNITITGSVTANGGSAANADEAGGGGAGGSILFKSQSAVLGLSKVTATGGIGGTSDGGNGGVGRIRCDYYSSVTGTTSPAFSFAQDTGLIVAEAGMMSLLI